jgi:PTS system mannose-specific IIC component
VNALFPFLIGDPWTQLNGPAAGPVEIAARLGAVLALGAWTAVDSVFLQVMVSQPLVAGWLAGLLVGAPGLGLGIGLLLQLVWIRDLPMGGRAMPAAGPAAVVGVWFASAAAAYQKPVALGHLVLPQVPYLVLVLFLAILVGEAGRRIMGRRVRSRADWVAQAEQALDDGHDPGWRRLTVRGIGEAALVGVGLTLGGLLLAACILLVLPELNGGDPRWAAYPVLGLGLGMALSLAGKRTGALGLGAILVAMVVAWGLA